jgi:hypothetical protein
VYVSLDETKEYLGVYFTEKDTEITLMIEAAERHVENFLGKSLSEATVDTSGDSAADLDAELLPNVKLAILMHVAGWFNNKQVTQETALNENPEALRILHFERTGLGV